MCLRDATAIEAREKPVLIPAKPKGPICKRDRLRKGEEVVEEEKRLERKPHMNLPDMITDLPKTYDPGMKRNAKGHTVSWKGYMLHIDATKDGTPLG